MLRAALHNTYCSKWSGIVYVAFVVDAFSRRIVGWKAARTMATSLVLDALKHGRLDPSGHRPRRPDLPQRRRQPGQYTSITYTTRLAEIGANPSIGSSATVTTVMMQGLPLSGV